MITITEALAELKTLDKRISSKKKFVTDYLFRQENTKDPLEKEGGAPAAIASELQAIGDLEKRVVELRRGIQKANEQSTITLEGETKSIADWLVWRREVAPSREAFLVKLSNNLNMVRDTARKHGSQVYGLGTTAEKPTDIIVNLDEKSLAQDIEKHQNILGQLDGQLSLKNATVTIA